MTIIKSTPVLDGSRANTDVVIRSGLGNDIQSSINAQWEMITDEPAPGSSIRNYRGHTHDQNGNGRGIMRMCNGGFSIHKDSSGYPGGPPLTLTHNSTSEETMGAGDSSSYYPDSGASNKILGIAYVSPGIEYVRVETCWQVSTTAYTPQFRIVNLTDGTNSGWINITGVGSNWYPNTGTVEILRTSDALRRAVRRIEFDIEVKLGTATSTNFYLYAAFPYEYTDAPS